MLEKKGNGPVWFISWKGQNDEIKNKGILEPFKTFLIENDAVVEKEKKTH